MAMSPRLLRPRASGVFSPKSIASLEHWWDASDSSSVTLNGTTVSSWANKSIGPALAQGTAAAQPTYQLSHVNGKNALTFDGGDVLSGVYSQTLGNNTVVMVAREDVAVNFSGLFSYYPATGNDNANANAWLAQFATTDNVLVLGSASFEVLYPGSATLPLSVITLRRQIDAGDRQMLRTNGITRATNVSATTGTAAGILFGGRFQSGAISGSFRSRITLCEVCAWSRQLSASEYETVERYLARKWGITL